MPTQCDMLCDTFVVSLVAYSASYSKPERDVEVRNNKIKNLMNELEHVKKEKKGLDNKLTGFESASKDLDTLLGSQRTDKNKEGLGYNGESSSSIMSKPMIKFLKAADCPGVIKTNKTETARKSLVKYAEIYRNTSKSPKVTGKNWPKNNFAHKNVTPRAVLLKTGRTPIAVNRTNMNVAQPKMTTFSKTAHLNVRMPFQGKSTVRTQSRVLRVSTADLGNMREAIKASACWIWRPKQNTTKKGPNGNGVSGNSQTNIDDKGYWDSGCSQHITGNISYLSEYEPYDGGYVSFGQGGGKITGKDFKLKDDTNVLLRTPRQHNMYSINLNNVVPYKNLTCLVAKASVDESILWHKRLGHLNFKTMNKLVRNNLVKGLPSKYFENDHTCVACLKGKQHKASCKTKLVNSVSKPLHTLHMDLFRPTYVSSLNHKWYCLVVTDDFSRFTWTFFLRTNDETSGILRNFITEIENLKYIKVKIIRTPAIGFLRPFGYHVMILNTLDHLGKFEAKGDEGYFVRYSMSSKVFRVFNKRTKKVEENLHVEFLENKLIEKGAGPNWLFDIDTLTNSMNYVPVVVAGTSSTNILGTKDVASQAVKKDVSSLRYIALPNCVSPETSSGSRLISKWVNSQEETPSLDNALTLSNRFEDTIGVETDLSNMESSIPASPTPTFRIHKDHPKSQRIKPKKIFDALKDPSWVLAMQEELLQFKIQNVWILVDCPKGIRPIGIKWVLKNKKDERGIVIRNKVRLVAQGHIQEEGIDYQEVFAPVARIEAIRLFLAYASFVGFTVYQMDVKSSFLYGTIDEEGKDGPGKDVKLHLYRSMIGSLMYLTASRLDIMFAVCACARHQVTPKECHLHVVKRIFRYLKGHPKLGLWYPKESPFDLVAYSDSDYGGAT
nr:ribonuclease H-like domain-containing protein [Tanacetum cinerariifolium]